ncbi:MAG: hypothetical protein LBE91_16465 [Tannerella sp.]|jgi:hypothetical protein|nr:hypothetical protein [Tannerella sp.]
MKKLLFFSWIFIVAVTGILSSCSKDDEGGGAIPKDDVLYKTWYRVGGGIIGGENFYDEFIFNADGTFEYKQVASNGYRTIDGTFRIVGRTTTYVESDYAEAYTIQGYQVLAKFTIEFDSYGDVEQEDVFYLEKNGTKRISVPYLFGRIGDIYSEQKN